jgi:hypothetical protein
MCESADELNQKCLETLKGLQLEDYVIVIGSGPSKPFVPAIEQLQEDLCIECGIDKLDNEEFWDLAERAYNEDQNAYYDVIKKGYGKIAHKLADIYPHILMLPCAGFITFNYDNQIPEEFTIYPPRKLSLLESGGKEGCVAGYHSAAAFFTKRKPTPILAIHGCFDENNPEWHTEVILKRSDYDKHYTMSGSNILFEWWRNLLPLAPCIFIGTSLREPGLAGVTEPRHIHLLPVEIIPDNHEYPPPTLTFDYIQQVFYDPKDKEHSGLYDVIQKLERSHRPVAKLSQLGPRPLDDDEHFTGGNL